VLIVVLDKPQCPDDLGWATASSLSSLYPNQWKTDRLPILLGNERVQRHILQGKTPHEISAAYQDSTDEFAERRKPYLIYP